MRSIDTDALELVAPALGVGAPGTATELVEFDDGTLQQVFDVAPLVRRAGAPNTGIGLVRISVNYASGAGSNTVTAELRNPGIGSQGWPAADIAAGKVDVYLIGASLQRTSGSSTLTASSLSLALPSGVHMPRLDVGTGTQATELGLAQWDALITGTGIFAGFDGYPFQRIGIRLPPTFPTQLSVGSTRLSFFSTSDGVGQFSCAVLVAFLRAGLGQDVAL